MNKLIPLLLMTFLQIPTPTVLAQDNLERQVEQVEQVQQEVQQVQQEVQQVQQEVQQAEQELQNQVENKVQQAEQELQNKVDEKFQDGILPTRQIPDSTAAILGAAILFSSLLIGITIYTPLHSIEKQRSDQHNFPLTTMDDRTEFVNKVLPKVVEGITVYLIVAVVSILSLSGTIQPQGTITILASISGYVLGRQNQNNANSGTQSKPSSPVNQENNVLETSKESQKTTDNKKVEQEKKSEVDFSKVN